MRFKVLNLGGKQLRVSPFLQNPGEMTRCVNMDNSYVGAKTKRSGYATFLDTANGSAVTDLFSWTKADGTSTYVYRKSGAILSYWDAGVGTATTWTTCGAGTLTAGNHVGHAVLAETLFIGDGGGTLKFTASGTSLSTGTSAPIGEHLATYQNRIYVGGTASTLFYSASGSGADWLTTGTSDSSSLTIPGAGKINKVFVSNDRIVTSKSSGIMHRWDGYSLRKLPTDKGLSSPYSLVETEDYFFYLNRDGIYGFGGERPEIVSNAIQPQIYNNAGSGIAGPVFTTVPAGISHYDALFSVGDTTDTVSQETVTNAIIKYDYQLNQFTDYSFANKPTAWTTYIDNAGVTQMIFGDATGQCYKLSGTAVADGSTPIEAVMEGVLTFGEPESEKIFHDFWAIASPGCCARVQICAADTFTASRRKWLDVGQFIDGVAKLSIPASYVGRLLWWRVSERSVEAPFTLYGFVVDLDILKI